MSCLVSNPTKILSCFLFMPRAKRDSCLSGPFRNILACLHASLDCQSLRCALSAHDRTSVHNIIMVIPILGSGPMNTSQAAIFNDHLISYFITWNIKVSRNREVEHPYTKVHQIRAMRG